jgi:hypothetical protein
MYRCLVLAIDWQTISRRMALVTQDRQYKMGIQMMASLGDAVVQQRCERVYRSADQDGRCRSLHHLMNLDEETRGWQ